MRQLSPAGQQTIADLAQRHGFSTDATLSMLDAVINGNGGMAQFNHPEFSGSGQWMRGGMIMISDMFNSHLKNRIDGLCYDLANLVANQPDLIRSGSFQSQNQGTQSQGNYHQSSYADNQVSVASGGTSEPGSLFAPLPAGDSGNWWPADIGWPNSTGAQNNVRYAYFQQARRLAIDMNGTVTVYDTLDHQIGGFSQQQSGEGSFTFTSQQGPVNVASLPVISVNGEKPAAARQQPSSTPPAESSPPPKPQTDNRDIDIFATIDKLADLHGKGILTDQEFSTKKAELLSRL